MKLPLLLVLAGLGAAVRAAAPAPLTLSDALLTSVDGQTIVTAPGWALQGALRGVTPSSSPRDCAAACAARPGCQWATFCPARDGCADGSTGLGFQQCQLLGSNTTVRPTGLHGANMSTAAVFAMTVHPETFPGFATLPAQGLDGANFECAGSIQPGACAFQSAFDAVAICVWLPECRAVTVFANGTDGRSALIAVLKSSALAPSESFLAPSVYSVQQTDAFPLVAPYLHSGEATVTVPSDAELLAEAAEASGAGGGAANSTAWLGCIIANHSLMAGAVVEVVDGVEDAEQCCRLCREASGGACNAWNWCQEQGGCSYKDNDIEVLLQPFQCELRFQSLVVPKLGWPPALLGKGPHIPFASGSPLVTVGPPLPGYTRQLGSGLFGQRGYTCPESLKPQMQECVRSSSLEGHAQYCESDPRCEAFVYKPAGVYDSVQGTAIYKSTANSSAIILTPTSVLYIADRTPASSSLSPGAIAGICAGATALVAAVAALVVWRVRRQRRQCGQPDEEKSSAAFVSSSLPPTDQLSNGRQASKAAFEEAAPPLSGSSSAPLQPGLPPRPSRQPSAAAAVSCRTMLHRSLVAAPPMAPSPFAAAAMQAFASPPTAVTSPGAAGTTAASPGANGTAAAATPRLGSLPLRSASTAGEEAPMPELMQLIEQQDLLQESACSMPDVSAQLLAMPSNLPPELTGWVISPADITLQTWPNGSLKELGKGASGRVLKATYRGETVAAKEIDLGRNLDARRAFVQEALRLQQLRHPHVVAFFGVSLDGPRGVILQECCEGRDLHSALQLPAAGGTGRAFGWYRRGRRIALDCAKALNYLHSQGVVHMDVKSSNVLLTASGAAKLADVGLSKRQHRTYLSDAGAVGTFDWAAPEILMNGMQCTAAVDLFSFGVLLYEIITGERPVRGQLRMPAVPDECPEAAKELMLQCLSVSPEARPTAQEAMQQLMQLQRTSPIVSQEVTAGRP